MARAEHSGLEKLDCEGGEDTHFHMDHGGILNHHHHAPAGQEVHVHLFSKGGKVHYHVHGQAEVQQHGSK